MIYDLYCYYTLLGVYLRGMLDPQRTGKFAFYFEWISLRCGLDQNMIVLYGVEWRNPAQFNNTPYLLRIDELSVVIDVASLWGALHHRNAIKVNEIRFNKVNFYMEKLAANGAEKKEVKVLMINKGLLWFGLVWGALNLFCLR